MIDADDLGAPGEIGFFKNYIYIDMDMRDQFLEKLEAPKKKYLFIFSNSATFARADQAISNYGASIMSKARALDSNDDGIIAESR